jgi:hypothetical protein
MLHEPASRLCLVARPWSTLRTGGRLWALQGALVCVVRRPGGPGPLYLSLCEQHTGGPYYSNIVAGCGRTGVCREAPGPKRRVLHRAITVTTAASMCRKPDCLVITGLLQTDAVRCNSKAQMRRKPDCLPSAYTSASLRLPHCNVEYRRDEYTARLSATSIRARRVYSAMSTQLDTGATSI